MFFVKITFGEPKLFTITNDSLLGKITFLYPDSMKDTLGNDIWGLAGFDMDTINGSFYITKARIRISKKLLELWPNDALGVFGHELGHAIGFFKHSLFVNEIMHPAALVPEPSRQEGNIIAEVYSLPQGHIMGPYRYIGDLNPGPTSASINYEKLLQYFPPDPKKLIKYLPEDLKFENLPK